jgi:hypothetical protein
MATKTVCYPKRVNKKSGPKTVPVQGYKRSTPKPTGKKC